MANYLLAVTGPSAGGPLAELVEEARASRPTDVGSVALTHGWTLTWIARRAGQELHPDGVFTGFAYDDESRAFYFGSRGIRRREQQTDAAPDLPGCFFSARWTADTLDASSDLYRSMPMFLTTEPGLTIVSDSPYVLLRLRRRLGLPITLDPVVAQSLLWRNAMAAQLLGTRTLVQEIRYLPPGQRVRLALPGGRSSADVVVRPLAEHFAWQGNSYAQTIRTAATRIASTIKTVAGLGPEKARLSLSGGKDSRICLAATLLSPEASAAARFSCLNTHPSHQRDAEVVERLAAEFGFHLGSRLPPEQRRAEIWHVADPLGLWRTDCSLAYYALKMQSFGSRSKGNFAITGIGSELYKGNYGLRSLASVVSSVRERTDADVASAVEEVAAEALETAGIPRDRHLSAEWHYLAFRNALHGGRFVPVSKFGIRPLQQRELVGLSKLVPAEQPEGMEGPRSITDDLLVVLGPELAVRPFDDPRKTMPPERVEQRLAVLGGPVTDEDCDAYSVLGDPRDVHDGPVPTLTLWAELRHPRSRLDRESATAALDEAARSIEQSPLATSWSDLLAAGRQYLLDPAVRLDQAQGLAGRAISLAEVLEVAS
ncbi:hypothetical protein [Desertihabitans brevis]|nr:hypothetical protein [Desertihabitans brevis]